MTESQPRLCSSCLYWQSYPTLEGVGICDHPVSRYYQRGVMKSAEPCEYFVPAKTGLSLSDTEVSGTSPGQGRPA